MNDFELLGSLGCKWRAWVRASVGRINRALVEAAASSEVLRTVIVLLLGLRRCKWHADDLPLYRDFAFSLVDEWLSINVQSLFYKGIPYYFIVTFNIPNV